MIHKLLSSILMFTLVFGVLPSVAFAEYGNDEEDEESEDESVADDEDEDEEDGDEDDEDEISEEVEEAIEELEEAIFGDDDDGDDDDDDEVVEEGGDETVVVETVVEEEISEDVVEELEEAATSGEYPDKMYLSVQWGYFPAEDKVASEMEDTNWTGDISFESSDDSVKARPFKLIRFEEDQDYLDFEDVSSTNTSFVSMINGHHDGILFKVLVDLDSDASIVFETEYSITAAEVSLSELAESEELEFEYGDYKVVMKVWTHEDWLEEKSEHRPASALNPTDVEKGSWYERYMNDSVDNGFFQGYKDGKGKLTGNIGPNDQLTRFQLLKVMFELAEKLDMGVGALGCDPDSVNTSSATDWMADHWARGYVQCIEDAGYEVTVLDQVIDEDLVTGDESALRWEVIVTGFELLDIDTSGTEDTVLDDVGNSGLHAAFQDMIDKGVELSILSGYPDGSFKPFRQVNRAEMFKIVTLFYEVLSV